MSLREAELDLSDSRQLQLKLDWGLEPWEGRRPRALTKVGLGLFLRQKPPRHEVFFDPEQLDLWFTDRPTQRDGPFVYKGAPLLAGCMRRRRSHREEGEDNG